MVTVSVLMPVLNEERYLAAAIESVLGQTFADFEFLALDDGSTDATPDILREYGRRDRRMRIISRGNRGLVASLNELLGHAQGRFVARMDADDISLKHRFSHQVRFLDEHMDVVCLGGDVEVIDEFGRSLTVWKYHTDDKQIQERQLSGHAGVCHGTSMMRREVLTSIGGYDARYFLAEDLDVSLRLGDVGKLANLGEVIYRFRLHNKSLSEQAALAQHQAARSVCERAWRRRGIQGEFTSTPWRPGPGSISQHDYLVRCGWWAWRSGHRDTAVSYGLRAIRKSPMSPSGWKLLISALCRPIKTDD
jgi:GT2 family glycosyltransferase